MTFRQFISLRRSQRRTRRAHRFMAKAYPAWAVNADAVVSLLSAPTPLYAVDPNALDAAVRRIVADELAASSVAEEQAAMAFAAEPAVYEVEMPAAETFEEPVESLDISEQMPVEKVVDDGASRETSIFAEQTNGTAAVPPRPVLGDDERRRAFLSSFLQRSAGSPVTTARQ